jgi:hypothetical protein
LRGDQIHLGTFSTVRAAAMAVVEATNKLYGPESKFIIHPKLAEEILERMEK